jgi:hypothetical protein
MIRLRNNSSPSSDKDDSSRQLRGHAANRRKRSSITVRYLGPETLGPTRSRSGEGRFRTSSKIPPNTATLACDFFLNQNTIFIQAGQAHVLNSLLLTAWGGGFPVHRGVTYKNSKPMSNLNCETWNIYSSRFGRYLSHSRQFAPTTANNILKNQVVVHCAANTNKFRKIDKKADRTQRSADYCLSSRYGMGDMRPVITLRYRDGS